MTEEQKLRRREARHCGKSALNNLDMVRRQLVEAAGWDSFAANCQRRYGAEDTATKEAEGRAAACRRIAEHQAGQAVVNTRRAARWAIKSLD